MLIYVYECTYLLYTTVFTRVHGYNITCGWFCTVTKSIRSSMLFHLPGKFGRIGGRGGGEGEGGGGGGCNQQFLCFSHLA